MPSSSAGACRARSALRLHSRILNRPSSEYGVGRRPRSEEGSGDPGGLEPDGAEGLTLEGVQQTCSKRAAGKTRHRHSYRLQDQH